MLINVIFHRLCLALAALSLLAGCQAYQYYDVTPRYDYTRVVPPLVRPTIHYTYEAPDQTRSRNTLLEEGLMNTGLFSSVRYGRPDAPDAIHVNVSEYWNVESRSDDYGGGFVWLLTGGLVPMVDNYENNVVVAVSRGNTRLGQSSWEGEVTEYFGWIALTMPATLQKTHRPRVDRMVRAVIAQLDADRMFVAPPR